VSTADLRNYWTEFHETWWSYRYIFLVGPKFFSFVVKGVKVIFWKWRPVEIFQCRESIQDIIIYPHIKLWWYRSMLNHTNSTLPNFNAISHVGRLWCPELIPDIEQFLLVAIFKMATTISQKINIVLYHHNLWWAFWKWQPVEIDQCRESIRDIIIYPHIKLWWYRTMLNFCGIVVAMWVDNDVPNWFLTLKNFYRSPFSKWPPQYRTNSTLPNIIKIWYVGR
jgi:hypothetical protein